MTLNVGQFRIESNIMPEFIVDIRTPENNTSAVGSLIQPKVTYLDPLSNTEKVYAPYGEPTTWGMYVLPVFLLLIIVLSLRK